MAIAEHAPQSINLEGKLGFEARISGGHAFGQLTEALTTRLHQEPRFADVLQKFVNSTHSEKPKVLLSEELLGKWVGLAAEHTLLDAKQMPNEADGARWIQLEGEVARLEDAILMAHRGSKSVSLDERFIRIITDPSGDTQKKIVDSLDEVTQALSATARRATMKVLLIASAGAMIFSSCGPKPPTITPEVPTPTIEAISFQNLYIGHITLSVPGMPENIATSMHVENMNIDSNIVEALNMQGYSPVVSLSGTNFVGSLITVEGNKSALVNAPERLINYGGVGKLRLGEGTVLYGTYGETPLVLVRLLTLVPFEQNDGIYSAGAFVTKKIPGQELGSFVIIFFNANTGHVIQTIFAEFPENRNLRVEWQKTGRPIIYYDGQKQEY